MFQMVEELEGVDGSRKLLFLTNSQAEFLASSTTSLQKMLDALDLPKPKLVISLLMSQGYGEFCSSYDDAWARRSCTSTGAGVVLDRPPFLDHLAERASEELIDRFMSNVCSGLGSHSARC